MNRLFDMPGYSGECLSAFAAAIGSMPESRREEMSVTAQALLALVIIERNPSDYKNSDGYIRESFSTIVHGIVGGRHREWTTAAIRKKWLIGNGASASKEIRFRVTPCGNLSNVLKDVALYHQDPNALTPKQWEIVHRKVDLLNGDPDLDCDAMITAVAYALAKIVDSNHP